VAVAIIDRQTALRRAFEMGPAQNIVTSVKQALLNNHRVKNREASA
jgi:hypothetical protein